MAVFNFLISNRLKNWLSFGHLHFNCASDTAVNNDVPEKCRLAKGLGAKGQNG